MRVRQTDRQCSAAARSLVAKKVGPVAVEQATRPCFGGPAKRKGPCFCQVADGLAARPLAKNDRVLPAASTATTTATTASTTILAGSGFVDNE